MIAVSDRSAAPPVSLAGVATEPRLVGVLTVFDLNVLTCAQPDAASAATSHPAIRTRLDSPCVDAIRNIGSKVNLSRNVVATRGYGTR